MRPTPSRLASTLVRFLECQPHVQGDLQALSLLLSVLDWQGSITLQTLCQKRCASIGSCVVPFCDLNCIS